MSNWPIWGGSKATTGTVTSASSVASQLTAGGSANALGSWVELSSALPHEVAGVLLTYGCNSPSAALRAGVALAIGGSGSEVQIAEGLLASGNQTTNLNPAAYAYLPLSLPSGSRISAAAQATTASTVVDCHATFIAASPTVPMGGQRVTAYGYSAGTTAGTSIDAGASANTKSSWVQITASTTNPIRQLLVVVSTANLSPSHASSSGLLDVAVGAAAAEQAILSDLYVRVDALQDCAMPVVMGPFPVDIPSGTRLAVRTQSSSTSTNSARNLGVVLLGID